MEDNLNTHKKLAWIGLIILILILAVWFFVPRKANIEEKTLVEGVSGIQGIVAAFDAETNVLTLEQKKLEQNSDGTYKMNEKIYTVTWNDATVFKAYENAAALSGDKSIQTNESDLGTNKNVIVTPERTDKDGNVVAKEIRILPELSAQ